MISFNERRFSPLHPRRFVAAIAALGLALTALAGAAHASAQTIYGSVRSDGAGLANYGVSMYAAWVDQSQISHWVRIGSTTTDAAGNFTLDYSPPGGLPSDEPEFFVVAQHGHAMLASAIGEGNDVPGFVVVNELTTVATGNAFAQFIKSNSIEGNRYGMANAVYMAANFADPATGALGNTIVLSPNGTETSTLATFNSLANVVAACVADDSNCVALAKAATPPGGSAPANVLQALSNIVKYPAYPDYPLNGKDPVFLLSQVDPVHQPALGHRPTNWLLFLKITGGYYSAQDSSNLMNGPGNIAIDKKGYVWINANFVPRPADKFACAGRRLIKLYPWGENYPGSPYFGGGLSGAGFGITLDPRGLVWVGNFGFQAPICANTKLAATNNSVSVFHPDGTPISPRQGFTQGEISWPQGTVSDPAGNIWVGNCGNDSVTRIPDGNVFDATNTQLAPAPNGKRVKPFGVTVDPDGRVWVAGNLGETVSVLSPDGTLIKTLYSYYKGRRVLRRPMGDASDMQGNVWVANSDYVDVPCPAKGVTFGPANSPSVTMYDAGTMEPSDGSPYTGGGLTIPWGITVDGDDTVWVFNFGTEPLPIIAGPSPAATTTVTGISRFCGAETGKCPPGYQTGQPISPATGYRSDAIDRVTGGQIDPSGNIWMVNNYKKDAHPAVNPGGNSVVIVVGAAGPIKTPLIGSPVPFN